MKVFSIAIAISIFVLLYGGMHYYIYCKVLHLFSAHRLLLISLFAILGSSVFLVIVLSHGNISTFLATPVAYVSFFWMGLVFLFFSMSVPLDLLAKVASLVRLQSVHDYLAMPLRTVIVGGGVLCVAAYGYVASQQINIERLTLSSEKIKTPLLVVQISDLHLGLLSNARYIKQVVDTVNAIAPDIIVSTGDLVDMQMDHLDSLGKLMARLTARDGKFAVLGNHEALAGVEASRAFTERVGFTLLSNTGITVNDRVNIVGVDDPAVKGKLQQSGVDEYGLLSRYANGLYTVLLKHQPVVDTNSLEYFNLQLSGHTHGGQVFPFGLLIRLFYKSPFGLSRLHDDCWLYVSRGTGTWGPPMRVLAPTEITLIQLVPAKNISAQ